jgi:predicted DNA binding protein
VTTQEELDELMKEITRMAESGELNEKSRPLDLDDLTEEEMEILAKAFENEINPEKRNLQ